MSLNVAERRGKMEMNIADHDKKRTEEAVRTMLDTVWKKVNRYGIDTDGEVEEIVNILNASEYLLNMNGMQYILHSYNKDVIETVSDSMADVNEYLANHDWRYRIVKEGYKYKIMMTC